MHTYKIVPAVPIGLLRVAFVIIGLTASYSFIPALHAQTVPMYTSPHALMVRAIGNPSLGAAKPQIHSEEMSLIERVLNGEQEYFYESVPSYERSIYVSAFVILRNQEDGEEVAEEAVFKAFLRLNQFRGESKFGTWIIQITINEARMRRRKDRRHLYESIQQDVTLGEAATYVPRDFGHWRGVPSEGRNVGDEKTFDVPSGFRERLYRKIPKQTR